MFERLSLHHQFVDAATDIRERSMLSHRRSICFRHVQGHSSRTQRPGAMAEREDIEIIAAGSSSAGGTGAEAPEDIAAAKSKAKATPKAHGKRKARPRIDLDDAIARAQQSFKEAAKCMAKARADARNEKRKKARLFKKAAQLSAMDLERIAVLKRSGMWDPNLQGVCDAEALRAMEEQPSHTSASSGSRPAHPADNESAQPSDAMERALEAASTSPTATEKPEAKQIDDMES